MTLIEIEFYIVSAISTIALIITGVDYLRYKLRGCPHCRRRQSRGSRR